MAVTLLSKLTSHLRKLRLQISFASRRRPTTMTILH